MHLTIISYTPAHGFFFFSLNFLHSASVDNRLVLFSVPLKQCRQRMGEMSSGWTVGCSNHWWSGDESLDESSLIVWNMHVQISCKSFLYSFSFFRGQPPHCDDYYAHVAYSVEQYCTVCHEKIFGSSVLLPKSMFSELALHRPTVCTVLSRRINMQ